MKKVLLKISGMSCSACSVGLEKFLNKQEGIEKATVNLVMNNASIEYNESKLDLQIIEELVEKAGFKSLGIDNFELEKKKSKLEIYKLAAITIVSILILYISMSHMLKLPTISILDMNISPVVYSCSLFILTSVVLVIGRDILKSGIKNLIHKTPNMDTLVTIGVISSYLYSIYCTFKVICGDASYVQKLYFDSAAIIIFFIKIGKYIEGKNKDKTTEALKELMTITPNTAVILKKGKEITVTIDEIQKGDIIICKVGEKIAVDGEIIQGITHIDESFITGESVPVKREVGDKVIAGSINYDGVIKYKAEKIGKESTISEIVRLVTDATSTKAKVAKMADKISGYFVPTIIIIAIISFVAWILISKDIGVAINRFVTVLVIACPCSLGLATPLAIVVASGICSKKGILVKTSEVLENAHKVKTIVFDKTGTLTKGDLSISKLFNYSDLDDDKLLQIVASIENKSNHPIAKAIVNFVNDDNIDFNEISEFKEIPGQGILAKYKEANFLLGNRKLMQENGIDITNENDEACLVNEGNSIVYIAREKKIIGLIGLKDVVKDNVEEVIEKIKSKNIDVIMLTGDNEKTANNIAKSLNITNVIAEVKPKEKAEIIKKLKEDGLVMMCGDGINDSISLAQSDIGVSISSGTDIARDSSSVVIMSDNLNRINDLINISKKTIVNIQQNLFWAFFYNICMVPIAVGILEPFGIVVTPMMGAFAMTISSLTVVLNALRLKTIK